MSCVVLEGVSKTFHNGGMPTTALTNITLRISSGEFVVLLGPSGSGKSTVLRLLAGLESPTTGDIWIADRLVNSVAARDRNVALIPQDDALFPHLTVRDNIALGLRIRGIARDEIDAQVKRAADSLGLATLLARLPGTLSGGERRRVALARMLVRHPQVMLFDEPLAQLDPLLSGQIRQHIRQLHHETSATAVYVTHDQMEALGLGQRLVVLKAGCIQQIGAPATVYRHPTNIFVASFLGSPPMNLMSGSLRSRDDRRLFVESGSDASHPAPRAEIVMPPSVRERVKPSADDRITAGIRPEKLRIVSDTATASPGTVQFRAVVTETEYRGADTLIHCRTAAHRVTVQTECSSSLEPGSPVCISTLLDDVLWFDTVTGAAFPAGL